MNENGFSTATGLTYYSDPFRHLVCYPYSIENLHLMAKDLGIDRCWFHLGKNRAHYDIPKLRIAEIQAKSKVILPQEIVHLIVTGWPPTVLKQ